MKRIENMKRMTKKYIKEIVKAARHTGWKLAALAMTLLTAPMTVYASDAESAWNTTMDAIQPWITRVGIVLMVLGAIEFAVSQSNEDAAQKTRAARFMIAGAIVVAVSTQLFPMLTA